MRLLAVLAAASASLAVCVAWAPASAPPPGATALCRDGTYSFSRHRSGTCSHHGGVAQWLVGGGTAAPAPAPALGDVILLGARTRAAGCRRGPLPDRRCSPGAYYSGLTAAVLCSPSFRTASIRRVPQSEKYAVEREYGLPERLYGRTIELDHIVPLELGGANEIANLFPEPGGGAAGYHVKDALENRLHALVCRGQMTLAAARRGIAANWEALYEKLYRVEP